jgi:hypothetical protein
MNYQTIEKLAEDTWYYTLVSHVAYGIIEGEQTFETSYKDATSYLQSITDEDVLEGNTIEQLKKDAQTYVTTWKEVQEKGNNPFIF